jgi:uncharacterized membrane protein YhiD involved in acid resistance
MSEPTTSAKKFSAGAVFAIIGGIATTFGLIATVISLIVSVNSQWTQFQADLRAMSDRMRLLDANMEQKIGNELEQAAQHRNQNTLRITVLEEQMKVARRDGLIDDKLSAMQKLLNELVSRSKAETDWPRQSPLGR